MIIHFESIPDFRDKLILLAQTALDKGLVFSNFDGFDKKGRMIIPNLPKRRPSDRWWEDRQTAISIANTIMGVCAPKKGWILHRSTCGILKDIDAFDENERFIKTFGIRILKEK